MWSLSAPVCSHPVYVCPASGQPQNRVVGSAKGNNTCILAMSSSASNHNLEESPHQSSQIPKMEPFNRSRISRGIRDPSLLEKAGNAIMDRCSILEGEASYECWETFFEFEKMKEESEVQCSTSSSEDSSADCRPLQRIENIVRQSGGVKSLIDNISMVARISKLHKEAQSQKQNTVTISEAFTGDAESSKRHSFPEPDGLPKTQEELEEEEKARMPDSPYTRMLRRIGLINSNRSRNI